MNALIRLMIIIPTNTTRIDTWLKDCLASLDTLHPVTVVFQGEKPAKGLKIGFDYVHKPTVGFDPGAIVWAMENLAKDDEFFVLHDSCIVKDNLLWKVVFDGYWQDSVALSKEPVMMGMFIGKYRMEICEQLEPPVASTKEDAVKLEESWNNAYCTVEQPILLERPLVKSDTFEHKHGRDNMVLENRWLKKYKGTWSPEQL